MFEFDARNTGEIRSGRGDGGGEGPSSSAGVLDSGEGATLLPLLLLLLPVVTTARPRRTTGESKAPGDADKCTSEPELVSIMPTDCAARSAAAAARE